MANRTTVRVFLDNAAIDRLTLPRGMVHTRVNRLATEVLVLAGAEAPIRTGTLKASLRRGGGSFNQYGCSERVSATAAHARYVLGGTGPFIFSNSGKKMAVGKSNGEPRAMWSWANPVRGQVPNNFLGDALSTIMRRHGL